MNFVLVQIVKYLLYDHFYVYCLFCYVTFHENYNDPGDLTVLPKLYNCCGQTKTEASEVTFVPSVLSDAFRGRHLTWH